MWEPAESALLERPLPLPAGHSKRYLADVLETMGEYVDSLKFAGSSFSFMPRRALKELNDLCHAHQVLVSTGGFIERVLTLGRDSVSAYIEECRTLEFDIIEISSGFITIPADDWLRVVDKVQKAGTQSEAGSRNPVWSWRRNIQRRIGG
jgi:phosphosulfolactate synthase (CoM biosynthesis protein A)